MKPILELNHLNNVVSTTSDHLRLTGYDMHADALDLAVLKLNQAERPRIEVTPRQEFGQARAYPSNDLGRRMAELLDAKSFTARQLQQLVALGYEVIPVYSQAEFESLFLQAAKETK